MAATLRCYRRYRVADMKNVQVDIRDSSRPLDPAAAIAFAEAPGNGAAVLFIGSVRNRNHGRDVIGVSYDVHEAMATRSFQDICAEACGRGPAGLRLYVAHAKGRLPVGGLSVVIAAASPHRDEAFKACRYVIEQIKHRSTIWKQEHYVDGDSEWLQGHALCSHNDSHEHDHKHEHGHAHA
jgi:molybdopterin synthase catalytic subunit